jgi:hypothetical protein
MQTPLPKRFELKLKDSARKVTSNKPQRQPTFYPPQATVVPYTDEPVFVDKSEPTFQEPTFTEPAFDESFPVNLDLLSISHTSGAASSRPLQSQYMETADDTHARPVSSIAYTRESMPRESAEISRTSAVPYILVPEESITRDSVPRQSKISQTSAGAHTSKQFSPAEPAVKVQATSSPFNFGNSVSAAPPTASSSSVNFMTYQHTQEPIEKSTTQIATKNVPIDKNVVDLATLITLMTELVLAGIPASFSPLQLKELSDATGRLAEYLPPLSDTIRVLSHNVKMLPVPTLEFKRLKRLKDDYNAVRDRVRPLQDALRVIVLDRKANAPKLVSPAILLLIGGTYSMIITLEQASQSQMDAAFASITQRYLINECVLY